MGKQEGIEKKKKKKKKRGLEGEKDRCVGYLIYQE